MEAEKNLEITKQISRLVLYQMPTRMVIARLGVIFFVAVMLIRNQVWLGVLIAVFMSAILFLKLRMKHAIPCPECGKPFFGPFKLFQEKRLQCASCDFDISKKA